MKIQNLTKIIVATLAIVSMTVGCAEGAGGKGRKTRISGKATPADKATKTKDAATDTKIPNAVTTTESGGEEIVKEALKNSTFDQTIANKAQDEYESRILSGSAIFNKSESKLKIAELKGKTLSLKRVAIKIVSSSSTVKGSNYSGLSFYDIAEDGSYKLDAESSMTTGSLQNVDSYILQASTKISFDENGVLKKEEVLSNYVMGYSMSGTSEALVLSTPTAKDLTVEASEWTLEPLSEITNQLTGTGSTLNFSSKTEVDGSLQILKAESSLTFVVEVIVDAYTTQTFALTFAL